MKSNILAILVSLLVPLTSFAAASQPSITAAVVKAAVQKFEKEETAATVSAFIGVKGWPSGAMYNVKVYLNNATKEIAYTCDYMDHSGSIMIDCTK